MSNKENIETIRRAIMSLCDIIEVFAEREKSTALTPYVRTTIANIKESLGEVRYD